METLLVVLGILLIIGAVFLKFYKVDKRDGSTGKETLISNKTSNVLIATGALLTVLNGLFFYNPAGTVTAVQYLWGGDEAVTSQGLKLQLFGKTIPVSYEIAVQEIITEDHDQKEGIYYKKATYREFSDAIKAKIATSLIIGVNFEDEDLFLNMADRNKSEQKLVYARIMPVYDQALKNTCKLLDAQDYISGAASQFDYYLKDQLEHGMYLTKEEIFQPISTEIIGDSGTVRTVASGQLEDSDKSQKKYIIQRDANGDIMRDKSTSLKRYGLTVLQAAVTSIDWEDSFDTRLDLQKDQVAQTQIEKQEAEKEKYATAKEIAKGEKEKAVIRVEFEKEQIKKTIAAETRAKAAAYKEQEETNLLAAAKKEAQRIKVTADAQSYEIKQKVNAGITPEVRLQMELDASVARVKAAAGPEGFDLPSTVMTGMSGGSGNSNEIGMLESIIGAGILSGDIGNSNLSNKRK